MIVNTKNKGEHHVPFDSITEGLKWLGDNMLPDNRSNAEEVLKANFRTLHRAFVTVDKIDEQ